MAKHFIEVANRRVEVSILRDIHGGVQVEAVRAYPSAKGAVVKGQLFTVPHDQLIRVSNRELRNVQRAKAHNKRCREQDKTRKAPEGSESSSESLKGHSGTSTPNCPVCGSQHVSGACKMVSADMNSK